MRIIYTDEICVFAQGVLGGEDADDAALKALCAAASGELLGRLREGTDVESIKPLFVTAAGVLALSMYMTLGDAGLEGMKAGNLSLSFGDKAASAHSLRTQAEAMLSAYLRDAGFDFRGVEG